MSKPMKCCTLVTIITVSIVTHLDQHNKLPQGCRIQMSKTDESIVGSQLYEWNPDIETVTAKTTSPVSLFKWIITF